MDETGLWKLFFATGLPEAWMAAHGGHGAGEAFPPLPAPNLPGVADTQTGEAMPAEQQQLL